MSNGLDSDKDQHFVGPDLEPNKGAQWLSGRVLDLRLRGHGFQPHWSQCVVSLSRTHFSLLSTVFF